MNFAYILSDEARQLIDNHLNEDIATLTLKLSKNKDIPARELIQQVNGKKKQKANYLIGFIQKELFILRWFRWNSVLPK